MIESLREIIREVYLKFSKKGMVVQSMDPAHVAFVTLLLEKTAFDKYECQKATKVGIDLEYFGNILRLCRSPLDKLTLRLEETDASAEGSSVEQTQSAKYNFIKIIVKCVDTSRETEFTMKLINFEDREFKIPKLKHDSLLCMRSADYTRICRDLENISETVHISFERKGISLKVKSDIAEGSICIYGNDEEEGKQDESEAKLLTEVVLAPTPTPPLGGGWG